ncbi:UNVERIFIED_CONTAM: hypothetical protein Sindi_3001200 [Sesamum indicum]
MPSSSSSNSRLRSGFESSSSHSESASGSSSESGFGSSSGSGSRPVSKSSHGSYSTSPKRNKKFSVAKLNDERTGPSTLAKFQDRLAKNPWEAVVSTVRMPVHKIREKYHIPSDFDVVIPATFDRMHRPPEGFCAFSIKHLDAGLRFPLAPPVAAILKKLGLCPMQLSPNSITHIILFVSWLEGDQIKSLSALKSNVGAWLDRYIFVRPPNGVWPFPNEWTKYKPIPKMSGGGLEGDQIKSLASSKYDPKKLLTEKVLQLFELSPASLHIEESLGDFLLLVSLAFIAIVLAYANFSLLADSIIMSMRTATRRIAAQNKARKGGEVASSSDPKGKGKAVAGTPDLPSSSPPPVPSKALAVATPTGQQPITVDSEDTPSAHGGHLGYNSLELELDLDEGSGDHGADQGSQGPPPEERPKKRKRSSPKKGHGSKSKLGPGDKGKGKSSPRPLTHLLPNRIARAC